MLTRETITFLKRLDRNNNREWLQAHKPDLEIAKEDFANFVADLIGRISKFDPKIGGLLPESCTFRIYHSVRVSILGAGLPPCQLPGRYRFRY